MGEYNLTGEVRPTPKSIEGQLLSDALEIVNELLASEDRLLSSVRAHQPGSVARAASFDMRGRAARSRARQLQMRLRAFLEAKGGAFNKLYVQGAEHTARRTDQVSEMITGVAR